MTRQTKPRETAATQATTPAAPARRSRAKRKGPEPNQLLVLHVIEGAAELLRITFGQPGADTHGSASVHALQSLATSMCRAAAHLTEAEQSARALATPQMTGLPETTAQLLSQHRTSVRQGRNAVEAGVRLGDTLRTAYSNNKELGTAIADLLAHTDELSAALTAVAPDVDDGSGTAMQRLRRDGSEPTIVVPTTLEPVPAASRRQPWWANAHD